MPALSCRDSSTRTPLAEAVAQAGDRERDALERDVCAQWQEFPQASVEVFQQGVPSASISTFGGKVLTRLAKALDGYSGAAAAIPIGSVGGLVLRPGVRICEFLYGVFPKQPGGRPVKNSSAI